MRWGEQTALLALEYTFCAAFIVDFVVKFYLSESRLVYLASFDGLAAIGSIIPVFVVQSQASYGFLRVLRVYRLARKIHNQTTVDIRNAWQPTVQRGALRQIFAIVVILTTYTFISAGIIFTLQVGARSPSAVDSQRRHIQRVLCIV